MMVEVWLPHCVDCQGTVCSSDAVFFPVHRLDARYFFISLLV